MISSRERISQGLVCRRDVYTIIAEDVQLDERKKITHVIDRRTGESVYGPTDVADAKKIFEKQIQPNKFMIGDHQRGCATQRIERVQGLG